jgi:hypothetical protein
MKVRKRDSPSASLVDAKIVVVIPFGPFMLRRTDLSLAEAQKLRDALTKAIRKAR